MKHKASKKPKAIVHRHTSEPLSTPPIPDDSKGNAMAVEGQEVAGRHRNVGQKDHKGAR